MKTFAVGLIAFLAAADLLFAQTNFPAHPAPEWDKIFQRTNGWLGADGNYSVPLSRDKILWLFSDTWVGEVKDGKRVAPRMINNSIGIQRGTNPATASVDFFYPKDKEGNPTAVFKPDHGRGYFWLFGSARTDNGVFIFLQNVENYKTGTPFGFRTIGTYLGQITNPEDEPSRWKTKQTRIPFAKFEPNEKLMLGGAILHQKPFVYIYGTHTETNQNRHAELVLIRVRDKKLSDFKQWEFWTENGWSKSNRELRALSPRTASEFSVSWVPKLKKFALVQSDGIFGGIKISLSEKPEGPWSKPQFIFQTPESKWPGVFCYAGKVHPELAGNDNELILTYAANAWNFFDVINDARLYWPRFVRINLADLNEEPAKPAIPAR